MYRSDNKFVFFSVLFLIFTTQAFGFIKWNPTLMGQLSYFVYAFIIYCFIARKQCNYRRIPLNNIVRILIITSCLHIISKIFVHNESILNERQLILGFSTFLLFFIFWNKKIEEKTIIRIMTIVGLSIFSIQIFQQLFPGSAMFGIYNENLMDYTPDDLAEIRNGLYRYRIPGMFVVLFCMYYYWTELFKKTSVKNITLTFVFICSMYLSLTRQIQFASLITLLLSFFIGNRNHNNKKIIFVLAVFLCFTLINYYDVLFGELVEKTSEEANEDNIRVFAFMFYWEKIIDNPISFLFGNGYVNDLSKWQEDLELYTSDIGLVGEWYLYGVIWVIMYFVTLFIILKKYSECIPKYIKLFLIGTSINSILVFPYRSPYEYFVWISVLYICSIHISDYQKKKQLFIK